MNASSIGYKVTHSVYAKADTLFLRASISVGCASKEGQKRAWIEGILQVAVV